MPRYDIRISVRRTGKGRWATADSIRIDPEALTAAEALEEALEEAIEMFRKMLALRDKGDERP